MKEIKEMTFNEMAAEILSTADTSVEIEHAFIQSTHLFVDSQKSIIATKVSKGIDLSKDSESIRGKSYLRQILYEVRSGRVAKLKKWSHNKYL